MHKLKYEDILIIILLGCAIASLSRTPILKYLSEFRRFKFKSKIFDTYKRVQVIKKKKNFFLNFNPKKK